MQPWAIHFQMDSKHYSLFLYFFSKWLYWKKCGGISCLYLNDMSCSQLPGQQAQVATTLTNVDKVKGPSVEVMVEL